MICIILHIIVTSQISRSICQNMCCLCNAMLYYDDIVLYCIVLYCTVVADSYYCCRLEHQLVPHDLGVRLHYCVLTCIETAHRQYTAESHDA